MSIKLERRYGHMAYNRETFKDRVEEYIGGAWLEFYKARLATKNGKTKWVDHWMSEVRSLLTRFQFLIIDHEIRGFKNRRKAIAQVILLMQKKDPNYRRGATSIVKKDFAITRLRFDLDATDRDEFWGLVQLAIDEGLSK